MKEKLNNDKGIVLTTYEDSAFDFIKYIILKDQNDMKRFIKGYGSMTFERVNISFVLKELRIPVRLTEEEYIYTVYGENHCKDLNVKAEVVFVKNKKARKNGIGFFTATSTGMQPYEDSAYDFVKRIILKNSQDIGRFIKAYEELKIDSVKLFPFLKMINIPVRITEQEYAYTIYGEKRCKRLGMKTEIFINKNREENKNSVSFYAYREAKEQKIKQNRAVSKEELCNREI